MKYRKYQITLNDDGKIVCGELDIVGDTVEDVKKAIRATEMVQAANPKINIIYQIHGFFEGDHFVSGTTTGRVTNNKYERIWVTYTDVKGKQKREKVSAEYVYLDTPENWELAKQIELLSQQEQDISTQVSDLKFQLKKL